MRALYRQIAELGKKFQADTIILFGSRARGDHRERSDIDLAIYGMPSDRQPLFQSALEDLPTLLDFDVVFITDQTSESLKQNIKRDGIIIMDKLGEKFQKLVEAAERLKEALDDYDRLKITSIRDGVIQRFEFCTELSWKTAREYLLNQGYTDINSPKSVMKKAYADGLIDDESVWIDLLNARKSTSHIYDEGTANEVFEKIKGTYYPAFCSLIESLKR